MKYSTTFDNRAVSTFDIGTFTAEEAKSFTKVARVIDMRGIYDNIRCAAKKGDSTIIFDLEGNYAKFVDEIVKTLKKDGYAVKHHNGYDQRDGDAWNYLSINWGD
jgi:hypothetical protein